MTTAILFFLTFPLTIYLSTKLADNHYKTYKGNQPLYVIYGLIVTLIYSVVFLHLVTK